MLRVGVGHSCNHDGVTAALEASEGASQKLGCPADFALVFATATYSQGDILKTIQRVMPHARLSGCSAEGVISGNRSDEVDYAVAVMAIQSDSVRFEPFLIEHYSDDPSDAGYEVARRSGAGGFDDIAGIILLLTDCVVIRARCSQRQPAHSHDRSP